MIDKNYEKRFFQYTVLYLIIFLTIFVYIIGHVPNFYDRGLTSTTFNNRLYYMNTVGKFSPISFTDNQMNNSFSELSLDDERYQSYCLNITQKKHVNLYKIKSEIKTQNMTAHLPNEFKYQMIDESSLREYLNIRGSILSDEPYFSSIIDTSKEFNLNPLLLFAIAGQEQSFVPKENKNAEKIANNPYNVFNSWQKYNTNIYDSSRIVSRTVINLSKGRPSNVDLFVWINRKYSEDKDWHYGVRSIYEQLKTYSTYF